MDVDKFTEALTPEIVENFKTAVELGKWADGRVMTKEQKETCIQAIIAFEHKHLPENQRTGYVPPKEDPCAPKDEQPIKWTDDE